MKILLVQPFFDTHFVYQDLYDEIMAIVDKDDQAIDLIVFPEAFAYGGRGEKERWDVVDTLTYLAECPVLVGFSTEKGTEEAYFSNPFDQQNYDNQTEWKIYTKHSTAETVYFESENDKEVTVQMYEPIRLHDKKIQVVICHDMFYPLLVEKLNNQGMDLLINLTGGNVKMSKWCGLLKGRSYEIKGPVLCTMGNRVDMRQPSDRIAYINGKRLAPNFEKGDGTKENAYSIFDLENPIYVDEATPYYSDKHYDQFTLGLKEGDCRLDTQTIYSDLDVVEELESSIRLKKGNEIVHVHAADEKDILDRTYVFKQRRVEGDHEVFVYMTEKMLNYDEVVALIKLRVIENRIAAIVLTPDFMIGAKTNRYKDVQLFDNDFIGFDLQHMKGFESVYEKSRTSTSGLNLKYKKAYEALV
jgi:predicted amidohydrolase